VTRIVAGAAGGRRLAVPPSGTRPTSDRVREALFSALAHDPGLDGTAVLDLCAGSGALGLEALSRGAAHVLLVESDRRAAAVLRRNVAAVDLPGAQVRAAPAAAVLAGQADRAFDLLLVDPPYATPDTEVAAWLTAALAHGWLADDATVVVERPSRGGPFPWPAPLQPVRERRYGETTLHLARCYRPSS
jgi:16S rRNA (guanine966-N2)-methyltransferase